MRKFIIIAACLFVLGCSSEGNSNENKYGIKEKPLIRKDSIAKLDSMKWFYYAMNYYGDALFYDSTSQQRIKIKPVECDVKLERYAQTSKDSSYYAFSFTKAGHSFINIDGFVYTYGLGSFKNNTYPLTEHIAFDYQNNPDSTKAYLTKVDTRFQNYLKGYQGKVSIWLKQEATRRGILQ